jgi:hypothetical protein
MLAPLVRDIEKKRKKVDERLHALYLGMLPAAAIRLSIFLVE